MRQYLLFDLTICSVWVLAVLGNESCWWAPAMFFLSIWTVILRMGLSFALYQGEKRTWLPLLLFAGLSSLIFTSGHGIGVEKMASLAFAMTGTEYDESLSLGIKGVIVFWIWALPVVCYAIMLCRKKMTAKDMTWPESLGAILWRDKNSRTYTSLMLAATCALYAGLAMDPRVCWFVCLVIPTLSLCLINRHYGMDNKRSWLMPVGMAVFFYAQTTAGWWRVGMLAVSLMAVVYLCSRYYTAKGLPVLTVVSTLYLGVLLPSLTIGNNQYACIGYAREGYHSLYPFRGCFVVHDGEKAGLRDRYGLLVEPKYEDGVDYYLGKPELGMLEFRRNGYYDLFDITESKMVEDNDIDHKLQDGICSLTNRHFRAFAYEYDDCAEIKVTETNNDIVLAHLKAQNKSNVFYDYNDIDFISEDTVAIAPGTFACDSLVKVGISRKMVMRYSYDLKAGNSMSYNIAIKVARENMPDEGELVVLAKDVAQLLKKTANSKKIRFQN